MKVIIGAVIEKDGKVLLVQEGKEKCYGKWNLPAGHLEPNESLIDGIKREIKEETGCEAEITGLLTVGNTLIKDDIMIGIVFKAELLNETISFDGKEIIDVKYFDIDDILNNMDNELRNTSYIKPPVKVLKEGKVNNIDMVNII